MLVFWTREFLLSHSSIIDPTKMRCNIVAYRPFVFLPFTIDIPNYCFINYFDVNLYLFLIIIQFILLSDLVDFTFGALIKVKAISINMSKNSLMSCDHDKYFDYFNFISPLILQMYFLLQKLLKQYYAFTNIKKIIIFRFSSRFLHSHPRLNEKSSHIDLDDTAILIHYYDTILLESLKVLIDHLLAIVLLLSV